MFIILDRYDIIITFYLKNKYIKLGKKIITIKYCIDILYIDILI